MGLERGEFGPHAATSSQPTHIGGFSKPLPLRSLQSSVADSSRKSFNKVRITWELKQQLGRSPTATEIAKSWK